MIYSNWHGQKGEYVLFGSMHPTRGGFISPDMSSEHQDILLAEKIGAMCPFVQATEKQEDVLLAKVEWMLRQSQAAMAAGAEVWDEEALTKVG